MRDLFGDIFQHEPGNPMDAAQRAMRPPLHKRFFHEVRIGKHDADAEHGFGRTDQFCVQLDGRPVKTPGGRLLAAPNRELAEAIGREWQAQANIIDPVTMPLTRLSNTIVDGVATASSEVAADITKYLGCDLMFYRARGPDKLVTRQAQQWDPVLAWARDALGAHFVVAQGLTFVQQPASAIEAASAVIPCDPWRLGAVHVITNLTGSALIALALADSALSVDAAWIAAHVDEDWNMELWGSDELALTRRAARFAEMQAAATVLRLVG
jgi:chaperone required for assembly of F1-ATPase